MTNKPAHSPLPWKETSLGFMTDSDNEDVIGYEGFNSDDDLKLCLKAVNSYYPMLEALKNTIRWIEKYCECSPPLIPSEWSWFKEAKEAIALAEKGI